MWKGETQWHILEVQLTSGMVKTVFMFGADPMTVLKTQAGAWVILMEEESLSQTMNGNYL